MIVEMEKQSITRREIWEPFGCGGSRLVHQMVIEYSGHTEILHYRPPVLLLPGEPFEASSYQPTEVTKIQKEKEQ